MNPSQKANQGRQGEIREILLELHESSRYAFEKSAQENGKAILKAQATLNRLITSEAVRIAQESLARITENGHGGGNFRRLILLEEERLAELVKGEDGDDK